MRASRASSGASHSIESDPRASLKRALTSALLNAPSDSKRAYSIVTIEAIEVKGECSQGLQESLLKIWNELLQVAIWSSFIVA